ncbi:VirK/YbjX family protein [Vibrio quintilis]|uniref:DUF535 domain-containing protein n=1 Tax=Vibrio quintilis TaxID=1117707 RepID=A0A1M7YSW6_9VIBR|nr:DUF535 family protein [Vibrio quintilis]SHO55712.1 hypothetical protein VQ7734_01458 [Vibrio quintilis]
MYSENYILRMKTLSSLIYSGDKGIKKFKKNIRFLLFSLIRRKYTKTLENTFFNDPELLKAIPNIPSVFEMTFMPYGCVTWPVKQRTERRIAHYRFISQIFGSQTSQVLSAKGIDLLTLTDRDGGQYFLNLYRGAKKEGSLGIRLRSESGDVYSLSFTVYQTQAKTFIMHIGAVQGPRGDREQRQASIKTLTRSFHGLRTKSFILEAALMLARIWRIQHVQAVSSKGHIYQAIRYKSSKAKQVKFDYDTFWLEHHGTPLNSYLYAIPLHPERKDPDTLSRNKRRLYTKRYQFLNELEQDIQHSLNTLCPGTSGAT